MPKQNIKKPSGTTDKWPTVDNMTWCLHLTSGATVAFDDRKLFQLLRINEQMLIFWVGKCHEINEKCEGEIILSNGKLNLHLACNHATLLVLDARFVCRLLNIVGTMNCGTAPILDCADWLRTEEEGKEDTPPKQLQNSNITYHCWHLGQYSVRNLRNQQHLSVHAGINPQ